MRCLNEMADNMECDHYDHPWHYQHYGTRDNPRMFKRLLCGGCGKVMQD